MELMHRVTSKGPLSKYNAGREKYALNVVSIIQNT